VVVLSPVAEDYFEELRARSCGPRLFELESIPFVSAGLALGDVVRAEYRDGKAVIVGIAERSGARTVSIHAFDDAAFASVLATFTSWQGLIEVDRSMRMIAVNLLPGEELPPQTKAVLSAAGMNGRVAFAHLDALVEAS
jgi:hypothetical protein